MKKRKIKKSLKTVPSWFLLFGTLFCVFFAFGIFIFTCLCIKYVSPQSLDVFEWIFLIFMFVIAPIIVIILSIRRGFFSIVTIDENGMRRALFGVFFKVSISWEELCEIKYFNRVVGQIFCSKESLRELSFNEVIKRRRLIQIPASSKVLAMLRLYTDKEIIGIPEETVQDIIKKYK